MPTISHATFQFARRQQVTDYHAPSSAMEVRKNCRHTASTGGHAEVYALSSRGQGAPLLFQSCARAQSISRPAVQGRATSNGCTFAPPAMRGFDGS